MSMTRRPSARRRQLQEIKDDNFFACVRLSNEREDPEYYDGESLADEDGDRIAAVAAPVFRLTETVQPEFIFRRGADRTVLCRVLRKFLAILEGPDGNDLVGLSREWTSLSRAYLRRDGTMHFFGGGPIE